MLDLQSKMTLEARINGGLETIGRLAFDAPPNMADGVITARRMVLEYRPVPSLGVFDAKKWLKNQMLVVTRTETSPSRHSTWSWCCRFLDCGGVGDISEVGLTIFTDVKFEV